MNLSADFESHHIEGLAQAAIDRGIPMAVALLRAKRSDVVLCNQAFERFLLEPWQ